MPVQSLESARTLSFKTLHLYLRARHAFRSVMAAALANHQPMIYFTDDSPAVLTSVNAIQPTAFTAPPPFALHFYRRNLLVVFGLPAAALAAAITNMHSLLTLHGSP